MNGNVYMLCAMHPPQEFKIGGMPPRVGGIKGINTSDDEVILEVPLLWGSDCQVRAGGLCASVWCCLCTYVLVQAGQAGRQVLYRAAALSSRGMWTSGYHECLSIGRVSTGCHRQ